ncbi:MAG: exosome 3'-5' exoribonuclease subunit Rrp6-related protein [Amphiamblys sp. WSBS2006]|nr:MAG: exosome 3'-5' exoribonuclease subunit Rrp6-related protein [Amphiamblys sp. WSBS2006]
MDTEEKIKNTVAKILGSANSLPHTHKALLEMREIQASSDITFGVLEERNTPGIEETPLSWVDSEKDLHQMCCSLENERVIAVDLEHSQDCSYFGKICLVQISTVERDYVVDALKLEGCLHGLNKVTASPRILKIFHGATTDVGWLHTAGVFVTNIFDTYEAAVFLGLDKRSLEYLLMRYENISKDKACTREDWTRRPLTDRMLSYARIDTRYLIGIHAKMARLLMQEENNIRKLVLLCSLKETVCFKVDSVERRKAMWRQHMSLARKRNPTLGVCEETYLKLHTLREEIASREDICCLTIIQNSPLYRLAAGPLSITSLEKFFSEKRDCYRLPFMKTLGLASKETPQ